MGSSLRDRSDRMPHIRRLHPALSPEPETCRRTIRRSKKTAEQSDKTETTEKETTPTPAEATETPVPTPTEVPVDIPIDFASLQKENEDIYAWIKIDGTNIDYPIVQSSTARYLLYPQRNRQRRSVRRCNLHRDAECQRLLRPQYSTVWPQYERRKHVCHTP